MNKFILIFRFKYSIKKILKYECKFFSFLLSQILFMTVIFPHHFRQLICYMSDKRFWVFIANVKVMFIFFAEI